MSIIRDFAIMIFVQTVLGKLPREERDRRTNFVIDLFLTVEIIYALMALIRSIRKIRRLLRKH